MTNYEMIQSLPKENLAVLLRDINGSFSFSEDYCKHCEYRTHRCGCDRDPLPCNDITPYDDVMAWLNREYKTEEK